MNVVFGIKMLKRRRYNVVLTSGRKYSLLTQTFSVKVRKDLHFISIVSYFIGGGGGGGGGYAGLSTMYFFIYKKKM